MFQVHRAGDELGSAGFPALPDFKSTRYAQKLRSKRFGGGGEMLQMPSASDARSGADFSFGKAGRRFHRSGRFAASGEGVSVDVGGHFGGNPDVPLLQNSGRVLTWPLAAIQMIWQQRPGVSSACPEPHWKRYRPTCCVRF